MKMQIYEKDDSLFGVESKRSPDEVWVKFDISLRYREILIDSSGSPVLKLHKIKQLHKWLGERIAEMEAAKKNK